ncbi:hypothetical protein KJ765_04290 [Candidatus Micrarchaeota archaeon]|nr:hypothetical protein [Candidatus Micrarchaeota archaeon]
MKKESLLKWFTIAMIVVFAFEIVLIGIPSGGFDATPTPSNIPTATLAPEFVGSATTEAVITGFGTEFLARCNTTEPVAVLLRDVEGITNAVQDPSTQLISITMAADANVSESTQSIRELLQPYCTPLLLRQALLEFEEDVEFTSGNDPNETKTISKRSIECFSNPFAGCYAFVFPHRTTGQTIDVNIFGRFQGSTPVQVFAEELLGSTIRIETVFANGTISAIENRGQVNADLPWENRWINITIFQDEMLEQGDFSETVNYAPNSLVRISGNVSNDTLEALNNLSMIETASVRLDDPDHPEVVLIVNDNYTRKTRLLELLNALEIDEDRVSFEVTKFSSIVRYQAYEGLADFLSDWIGDEFTFQRFALMRLDDPDAVEVSLQAIWEEKNDPQFVLVPADTASDAALEVRIVTQIEFDIVSNADVYFVRARNPLDEEEIRVEDKETPVNDPANGTDETPEPTPQES